MNIETATALLLDDAATVSIAELVEQSGLTEAELRVLVDCGALELRGIGATRFSARCIVTARTARRLRDDFAVDDVHAVAVMLRFVQRIEALEQRLRELQARG
jgi:chaperone modulatory protein CbpM